MACIALRRVNEGGVARLEGSYYQHGRPVPEYLTTPLAELIKAGYLTVVEASPGAVGMHQVGFMQEGWDWYAVLRGKRGVCTDILVCQCSETAHHGDAAGSRPEHGEDLASGGRSGGFPKW